MDSFTNDTRKLKLKQTIEIMVYKNLQKLKIRTKAFSKKKYIFKITEEDVGMWV